MQPDHSPEWPLVLPLVEAALALRGQHPETPAQVLLDAAMRGPLGVGLRRKIGHSLPMRWLYPPGAFSTMLRDGFASDLSDAELALMSGPDCAERDIFMQTWMARVIAPFVQRYRMSHRVA